MTSNVKVSTSSMTTPIGKVATEIWESIADIERGEGTAFTSRQILSGNHRPLADLEMEQLFVVSTDRPVVPPDYTNDINEEWGSLIEQDLLTSAEPGVYSLGSDPTNFVIVPGEKTSNPLLTSRDDIVSSIVSSVSNPEARTDLEGATVYVASFMSGFSCIHFEHNVFSLAHSTAVVTDKNLKQHIASYHDPEKTDNIEEVVGDLVGAAIERSVGERGHRL